MFRITQLRNFTTNSVKLARYKFRERPSPLAQPSINVTDHKRGLGALIFGGGSIIGLSGLCYYGLQVSQRETTLDRAKFWPKYVKDRIHSTYAHLGGGFAISAATAYATLQSPAMMRFFASGSLPVAIGTFAALVASHMIIERMPYEPGFSPKHLAWAGHCALLGSILAPISLIGGPVIIRAASYTAAIVGSLSLVAVCSPSEQFLNQAGPLSVGLGVVMISSIGSLFLPPASRIGMGLYGISLYGGLVVFSGLLVYNTQKTIKKAELHPAYSIAPYDPVNNSLHIYTDILNIFIRMVQIFGMGGQRKK